MSSDLSSRLVSLLGGLLIVVSTSLGDPPNSETEAARKLRALGGHTFLDLTSRRVVEINLNGNQQVTDETLKLVAACPKITDLSLEDTAISSKGLGHLKDLKHLEWLNLYRTNIDDDGLKMLRTHESLQQLPLGSTRISDRGLIHLGALPGLRYVGLRNTAVTDEGVDLVSRKLPDLRELQLGQTNITDAALSSLQNLTRLEKLWLHDTAVTGPSVRQLLAHLPTLRELHLQRTHLTIETIQDLRTKFPVCSIRYEK